MTEAVNRMKALVQQLLKDSPKISDGDDPAIECAVVLKSGMQINGALSQRGGLCRMMQVNERVDPRTRQPMGIVMVEHFFDYEQISDIAIPREVKVDKPEQPIIHSP